MDHSRMFKNFQERFLVSESLNERKDSIAQNSTGLEFRSRARSSFMTFPYSRNIYYWGPTLCQSLRILRQTDKAFCFLEIHRLLRRQPLYKNFIKISYHWVWTLVFLAIKWGCWSKWLPKSPSLLLLWLIFLKSGNLEKSQNRRWYNDN